MRISFGAVNKQIAKCIQKNDTKKLNDLTSRLSKKSPKEINELIQKTIQNLGKELSKSHVQSLFVGFIADLAKEEDLSLLTHIFEQNIIENENLTQTFVTAVIGNQGIRALKMIMAKPDLLFVHVKDKKPAFYFFNEEGFKMLLKSKVLNDDFFIALLKGMKK